MHNLRSQAAVLQQGKRAGDTSTLNPPKRIKRDNAQLYPLFTQSTPSTGSSTNGNNMADNSNERLTTANEISPTSTKNTGDSNLSKGITKGVPNSDQPYGKPLVWAEDRQALCEALPYYRAYQQGGYTNGGLGYGFLLDKDSGSRSYMDEEIAITRAGGGCKADDGGVMRQSTDQSINASHISSFTNNKDKKVPLALIVGSGNEACQVMIPHRYCVMDFFHVTDCWAEKDNGKTCFKFRFEKIDLTTKSWWAPKGSSLPIATRTFSVKAESLSCTHCSKESKKIFQQGWICLNESCNQFWMLGGGPAPMNLVYCTEFLEERTMWPDTIKPAFNLRPEPLKQDTNHSTLAVSLACWKGVVCPHCGRCNSRTIWTEWQCKTEKCGWSYSIELLPIPASAVLPDHAVEYTGHALPLDKYYAPALLRQPEFLGHWRIHTYEIMDGNTVTHFHSNGAINQMPGGPHEMFLALQAADLGLQRFPMRTSPVQGIMQTSHFATNFGMPYKYIVSVNSKPFQDAPKVIMNGLNRLTWAGKHAVGTEDYQNANELLALGYFEKQSIHYHDDGETNLGPTIATMSLGGEADMMIRMKERYFSGKKVRLDIKDPNMEIVPGCQLYEERMDLKRAYAAHDSDGATKARGLYLGALKSVCGTKQARPCLTMTLRHGDMVVMHGAKIQKYFEHEVTPKGKLRFALTSRYVNPARVERSEHWKGEFKIDPADVYNGDILANTNGATSSQVETSEAGTAISEADDGTTDCAFLDQWEILSAPDTH